MPLQWRPGLAPACYVVCKAPCIMWAVDAPCLRCICAVVQWIHSGAALRERIQSVNKANRVTPQGTASCGTCLGYPEQSKTLEAVPKLIHSAVS